MTLVFKEIAVKVDPKKDVAVLLAEGTIDEASRHDLVQRERLEHLGLTAEALSNYFIELAYIATEFAIDGRSSSHPKAREYYVPNKMAWFIGAIGNLEIGGYTFVPQLPSRKLERMSQEQMVDISFLLRKNRNIIKSTDGQFSPKAKGTESMLVVIDDSFPTASNYTTVLAKDGVEMSKSKLEAAAILNFTVEEKFMILYTNMETVKFDEAIDYPVVEPESR